MAKQKTPSAGRLVTLPLASLVEDMEIYPRHAVDDSHVASLVQAIECGAELPPIVADKRSKRITDGWHRARAWRRAHGKEATVSVLLKDYADVAAMIFDAVKLNAAHGRRLDGIDQTRSVLMLERNGFNATQISLALNVTEKRVERLRIKVATTSKGASGTVPGTAVIALKRPVRHLEGTKLTEKQAIVHDMLPGTSFLLVARQLAQALEHKMVDLEDEKLVEQLRVLRDLLVDNIE